MAYLGPRVMNGFKSTAGHLVIRVAPGGGTFYVMALSDDTGMLKIKKRFGPYHAR
jgi:hypothetical protein